MRWILPLNGVRSSRLSRFFVISAMPKHPSATLTRPTPSDRKGKIHREALHAAVDVGADLPEQHADQAHRHAVEQAAGGDEAHAHEPHQHERAVVGRPEQERHLAQRRGQRREHHDGHRAADEARNAGGEQGEAGLALERHLVAVDAGDDAAGVRNLHRDGAHAVAVLGAVVDSRQHDERAARGNRNRSAAAAG